MDENSDRTLPSGKGQFRRFFDSPFFGAAIYTLPDKRWVVVNDTFCELMGYSREELRGLTWVNLTHPDDVEENVRLFEIALTERSSDSYSMEKRFIRKDKSILHATIFALCVRKPDGTPDHNILLVQDISARKKAEAQVLELNRELERRVDERTRQLAESEARTQAIVDNVIDGIITVDEQGKILSVNPRIEAIFGYRSTELVGNDAAMLAPVFRRDVFARYIQRYWRSGASAVVDDIREVDGQRRNGEVFPMELAASEVNSGGMRFYVGVIRDITQRKLSAPAARRKKRTRRKAPSWLISVTKSGRP